MHRFFVLLVLAFVHTQYATASEVTVRFYSEEGAGGVTSDGRTFEDRYTDWDMTVSSPSARIAGSDDNFIQHLRNNIGNGYGSNYYSLNRLFFSFNVQIPKNAHILSANLVLYGIDGDNGSGSNQGIHIVEGNPDDPGRLQATDYSKVNDAILGSTNEIWDSNGWNKVLLNMDGINLLTNNDVVTFALRGEYDLYKITPDMKNYTLITLYTVEVPGIDKDPYLEITYRLPDKQSIDELLGALRDVITTSNVAQHIKQQYNALTKNAQFFYEEKHYIAFENQIEVLRERVTDDYESGVLAHETYTHIIGIVADTQSTFLEEKAYVAVPLITQGLSPYPSIVETSVWADEVYAGGRANKAGDCGLTIKQCGCAITSLVMLGAYRGIVEGIDGSIVNPKNLNDWLLAHSGYSSDGSVLWVYAFAYLGQEKGGKVMSNFSFAKQGLGVTDKVTIDTFLDDGNPVLAFNTPKGHWMVLTGIHGNGYYVRDPFWYNTKTTHDVSDAVNKVQGYSDVISKAHLIEYAKEPKVLQEMVELVLESPAELLITDEQGRRYGYDASVDGVVREIPMGMYDQGDFIRNPEDDVHAPHIAKRLMLIEPVGDVFTLDVMGTGVGAYHLTSAVSDGKGNITSHQETDDTNVGAVKQYTVITNTETDALPLYLKDVLMFVPLAEQKKFIRAFKVAFAQTEKGHVAVTEQLITNLIRYIEEKYRGDVWVDTVLEKLRGL